MPPPGNTTGAQIILESGSITYRTYQYDVFGCDAPIEAPSTFPAAGAATLQNVKGIELLEVAGTCGIKQLLWQVTYANGSVEDRNIVTVGDDRGFASLSGGDGGPIEVTSTWSGPGAVTYCPT